MKRRGILGTWIWAALLMGSAAVASAVDSTPGDSLRVRIGAAVEGATLVVEAGDYAGPFVISNGNAAHF